MNIIVPPPPRALLRTLSTTWTRRVPATTNARYLKATPPIVIFAFLGLAGVLSLSDNLVYLLTTGMAWAIAAVGVDLSTGLAGQALFGQTAFVTIGAYTFSLCGLRWNMSPPLSVATTLAVTALVSAIVGSAMVRLRNLGAVLTTFFFAFLVTALVTSKWLTPVTQGANGIPAPTLTLSSTSFYYVSLAVLLAVYVASSNFARSRAGRALRLIKRNEVIANTVGINPSARKLGVFVYAALLAAITGIFLSLVLGFITPDAFPPTQSIILFAMIAVGGIGTIWGGIFGAILLTALPTLLQGAGNVSDIVFAAILLVVLVALPGGLGGVITHTARVAQWVAGRARGRRVARRVERRPHSPTADVPNGAVQPRMVEVGDHRPSEGTLGLETSQLSINFGGVQALDGVTLRVSGGSVHALIGPNGAGKTTLLNCVTGVERGWTGSIKVGAMTLTSRTTPQAVASAGAARTFQNASLILDMDAVGNVELGLYGRMRWATIRDYIGPLTNRRLERESDRRAHDALDLVGLARERRHINAGELSMAERKLVDIARALAAQPRLLILDEPTAGLSGEEIDACASLIRVLNEKHGVTILVVSHHVGFIRGVAHRATVLDYGCVLAEGTPTSLLEDESVVDAFLGLAEETVD